MYISNHLGLGGDWGDLGLGGNWGTLEFLLLGDMVATWRKVVRYPFCF